MALLPFKKSCSTRVTISPVTTTHSRMLLGFTASSGIKASKNKIKKKNTKRNSTPGRTPLSSTLEGKGRSSAWAPAVNPHDGSRWRCRCYSQLHHKSSSTQHCVLPVRCLALAGTTETLMQNYECFSLVQHALNQLAFSSSCFSSAVTWIASLAATAGRRYRQGLVWVCPCYAT